MDIKRLSRQTCRLTDPPGVVSWASVAGRLERQGPLGGSIDITDDDSFFGKKTWEQGEAEMQALALRRALRKGGLTPQDVDCIFAGDLLNQNIGATFSLRDFDIPFYGVYGACSTMGEALNLGAMTVAAGYADKIIAMASSHFATAEKQFRFPLAYGNQRPFSATWTVTGCGAVVVSKHKSEGIAAITGITTGRMVDMGSKDSMNMGAAMAPAAFHTIEQNFEDFGVDESYYDKIITGDLGEIGRTILLDFMKNKDHLLEEIHTDCGIEIYDQETQDTHAGGSGCGCAATVLSAYILPKIERGEWERVLFVPTGALMSTVSYNEGASVPGIAHAIVLEYEA